MYRQINFTHPQRIGDEVQSKHNTWNICQFCKFLCMNLTNIFTRSYVLRGNLHVSNIALLVSGSSFSSIISFNFVVAIAAGACFGRKVKASGLNFPYMLPYFAIPNSVSLLSSISLLHSCNVVVVDTGVGLVTVETI